jgi:hypothetical protein
VYPPATANRVPKERYVRETLGAIICPSLSMSIQFEKPGLPSSENRKVLRRYLHNPGLHAVDAAWGRMERFTSACLAIMADPDEVLGRSGLPIRKAAA